VELSSEETDATASTETQGSRRNNLNTEKRKNEVKKEPSTKLTIEKI